jgi:hypothetical protein
MFAKSSEEGIFLSNMHKRIITVQYSEFSKENWHLCIFQETLSHSAFMLSKRFHAFKALSCFQSAFMLSKRFSFHSALFHFIVPLFSCIALLFSCIALYPNILSVSQGFIISLSVSQRTIQFFFQKRHSAIASIL